jgi:hypothetical protein
MPYWLRIEAQSVPVSTKWKRVQPGTMDGGCVGSGVTMPVDVVVAAAVVEVVEGGGGIPQFSSVQ